MLNISLFWPEKYHYNLISHLLHCILRLAMDLPSLRSPYLVQEPLQVASWPWGDPKISSLLGKRRIFHMGYKATPAQLCRVKVGQFHVSVVLGNRILMCCRFLRVSIFCHVFDLAWKIHTGPAKSGDQYTYNNKEIGSGVLLHTHVSCIYIYVIYACVLYSIYYIQLI